MCVSYETRERSGPYANIQSECDEISFVVWGGLFVQMVDLRVSYNCCWSLHSVQHYIKQEILKNNNSAKKLVQLN